MAEPGQDSRIKPAARKGLPKAKQDASVNGAAASNGTAKSASPQTNGKTAPHSLRAVDLGEPTGLTAAMRRLFRNTPSWLTSMLVHVGALLILGVLTLPSPVSEEVGKLISNVSTEQTPIEDINNNNIL